MCIRDSWLAVAVISLGIAASAQAQTKSAPAILTVSSQQSAAKDFSLADLDALPQVEVKTTNPWSKSAVTYRGPLLRVVLEAAGAKGQEIRATALNDYSVVLPVADAMEHNVILATRADGQTLSVRDKGPVFVIYPFDAEPSLKQTTYYERSIWQLRRLQIK